MHQCRIYAEANTSPRTVASAKALLTGLKPDCSVEVHVRGDAKPNLLFVPSTSDVVDHQKLAAAINGRLANQPEWFTQAFAEPLAKMRHVLADCSGEDCDQSKQDLRLSPAAITAVPGRGLVKVESPVSVGADFAEHFLLQYTEGFPMQKVGWGRVSRDDLNQLMEMNTRFHDFVLRTPYFAQIGASNLAGRILATLEKAASGKQHDAALGVTKERFTLLVGHDSNLAWLGGLLRLDWLLPDQTFNATAPGSALVFELHQNRATGSSSIQVVFISQKLDQIRNLTQLEADEPPAEAPVFIPGCSKPMSPGQYGCSLEDFRQVVTNAIDDRFVERPKN